MSIYVKDADSATRSSIESIELAFFEHSPDFAVCINITSVGLIIYLNEFDVLREIRIQNHYTIVPAPLGIEPNTVLTTQSGTLYIQKSVKRAQTFIAGNWLPWAQPLANLSIDLGSEPAETNYIVSASQSPDKVGIASKQRSGRQCTL